MARPLAIASAAWTVAILAAITGVVLPGDYLRLSLALFAFAVGLGLLVATVLITDGLRHRRARRRASAAQAQSVLDRLEYLPSVTTGTRRINWRGARYRVSASQRPQPRLAALRGSAYPRPASSTRQPPTDEAEASPRAW